MKKCSKPKKITKLIKYKKIKKYPKSKKMENSKKQKIKKIKASRKCIAKTCRLQSTPQNLLDLLSIQEPYETIPEELSTLITKYEKPTMATLEETEEINLSENEESKCIHIGTNLSSEMRSKLISLLKDYIDVFAWSYADMPGLDENVVVHKLPLKPGAKSVKQKLRRLKPEWILKIKEEVIK
jgi:hypothetical protein